MEHVSKGHITGLPTSHANLDALSAKYKGDAKRQALVAFAGMLVQAKALHSIAQGHAVAPLIRDLFSSLGAFTMEQLGWTPEEFNPIMDEFQVAMLADHDATMALRASDSAADAIEAQLREGQGVTEAKAALARFKGSLN